MITSKLISVATTPTQVFYATSNGLAVGAGSPAAVAQPTAITTLILCNKETPSLTNELSNDVDVSIYLARDAVGASSSTNIIVSNLTIPAGETVFFSDERIILDGADVIWVEASDANRLVVTVSSLPV